MSVEGPRIKKVLHILNGFGPGGVETWLLAAVKYLHEHKELGFQFDFLITGGVPRLFDEEIKKHGCQIFYNRYSYKSILSFRRRFIEILKENYYTAVHDHEDFISGWHYLLGGRHLPRIKIAHLHNPYNFVRNYVVSPLRSFSFNMGRKIMVRRVSAITGTSDAVMDEYGYNKPPFVSKRIAPLYCGFDTEAFRYDETAKLSVCTELNWPINVKIALFVGRIGLQSYDTAANQKNPRFAFDIAKDLVANHNDWRFIFAGFKGQTGNEMEDETRRLNLTDRIRFLDVRQDIPRLMSASDVLVFPSLWEGMGMVAVEAQCSGMKVVMSDSVPAEAIVCREQVAVKLLNVGVHEWVRTIKSLGECDMNRRAAAGRIQNSPFSIENSVGSMLSVYEG